MPVGFLDSNVLLYVASVDSAKVDRAAELIEQGGIISVQVLNEVTSVARREMQLSWAETRAFLATIRGLLSVRPVTLAVHEAGLDLAERYGQSTYDAMIAAAALDAGCSTLWSEDMQDGSVLSRRLRVRNPFVRR